MLYSPVRGGNKKKILLTSRALHQLQVYKHTAIDMVDLANTADQMQKLDITASTQRGRAINLTTEVLEYYPKDYYGFHRASTTCSTNGVVLVDYLTWIQYSLPAVARFVHSTLEYLSNLIGHKML